VELLEGTEVVEDVAIVEKVEEVAELGRFAEVEVLTALLTIGLVTELDVFDPAGEPKLAAPGPRYKENRPAPPQSSVVLPEQVIEQPPDVSRPVPVPIVLPQ